MFIRRLRASACLLLVVASGWALAEDVPVQFKVWGTRGPELAPVPAGWSEQPGEPKVRPAPKPTDADTAAGLVVFQRRPFEEVYYDTVPAEHERDAKLQTFAAIGQYEYFTFAFYALEDLKDIKVAAGDLKSKAGDTIPAVNQDVRLVRYIRSKIAYGNAKDQRYKLAPFYLEKHASFELPKARTAQIWITVKVPDGAKAGDYEGAFKVQAGGKTAATAPVVLRVLPFSLPPVPIETVMSYFASPDAAQAEKEMIDLREHGINNSGDFGAYVLSRDRKFGDDDVAETKRRIRAEVALRKKVFGAEANKYGATCEIGHQILYAWDQPKGWFVFWPHSPELEADFFKAIRVVDETLKAEGGPKMRLFIMDEPGGHPECFKETIYYNKLAREKMPDLEAWQDIGGGLSMGIDEIGQLGPYVDLLSTNRFNKDICKQLLDRKKPYGVYNGGGAGEAVEAFVRDRHFFGFYCWKTGANEILEWVYRFGNPWKDPIRGNDGYIYPTPDGPLPSITWESVRAGIDDYRYMDLLWRLITAAKKAGNADAAKAGELAALDVLGSIDFGYQGGGSPPPAAGTQEKWRWKIASACVELLKVVPLDKALNTTPERPGPLELPFPKQEADATKYGQELIAEGGFENGPGPWKMSGKGKGGIEEAEHHSGTKSFKIENAPDADGNAVTVCVWGWGGPGPSMTMNAGKTYEFSAWVKYTGAVPQLRASMPKGSTLSEQGKQGESDSSGWKRLSCRITMAKDDKPGYLAVWLQGPGTVWCDDFSMREIEVPPFVLEAPQRLIDNTDKVVTVKVKQIGGNAEASVRVTLPAGGNPVSVKVPPNAAATVEFPGSALAIGKHELKAELAEGGTYSSSLIFERVRGAFER